MKSFRTHTGEIVSEERFALASNAVADWYAENAKAIRREDAYASHVTRAVKEEAMAKQLAQAERIRAGIEPIGFWLWQRINTELTGECVAFLPKTKEAKA